QARATSVGTVCRYCVFRPMSITDSGRSRSLIRGGGYGGGESPLAEEQRHPAAEVPGRAEPASDRTQRAGLAEHGERLRRPGDRGGAARARRRRGARPAAVPRRAPCHAAAATTTTLS